MRYGFRWVAGLLVLAMLVPATAGAMSVPRASYGSNGWNPWSRLVAVVLALFGTDQGGRKAAPQTDDSCGYDPNGSPKCVS